MRTLRIISAEASHKRRALQRRVQPTTSFPVRTLFAGRIGAHESRKQRWLGQDTKHPRGVDRWVGVEGAKKEAQLQIVNQSTPIGSAGAVLEDSIRHKREVRVWVSGCAISPAWIVMQVKPSKRGHGCCKERCSRTHCSMIFWWELDPPRWRVLMPSFQP